MRPVAGSVPVLVLVTAHGRQPLQGVPQDRVIDVLNRHAIPWSAVSIYASSQSGGEAVLRPCLGTALGELHGVSELLIYFNRNVNPFQFALGAFKVIEGADPAQEATEYFYQNLDNDRSSSEVFLKKLTPDECRSVIAARVGDTVRDAIPPQSDVVVGVSGGGDSNALLYGFSQLHDQKLRVHPVIIKGIPDWDSGVPRAQELCRQYGLILRVMEEEEVGALIGLPRSSAPLIDRFERAFPGDDFEFLGTLLVRLALTKRAKEIGTPFICTGLNLEDVLCEAMFRVSTALKPAPFPVRSIGDFKLVLPLWLCPKRIIDGCFPAWSRENYEVRYP